jgi:hypothetical protein
VQRKLAERCPLALERAEVLASRRVVDVDVVAVDLRAWFSDTLLAPTTIVSWVGGA